VSEPRKEQKTDPGGCADSYDHELDEKRSGAHLDLQPFR